VCHLGLLLAGLRRLLLSGRAGRSNILLSEDTCDHLQKLLLKLFVQR
jgi:hypothetical protein